MRGDNAIQLELVPRGLLTGPVPAYFKVTYRTESGDPKTLITPPVLFETFDSTALKIVRKSTKDTQGNIREEIEFSPQMDRSVVDRYLRGPTTRPLLIPVSPFDPWGDFRYPVIKGAKENARRP